MELQTQYATAFLLSMAGAVLGTVHDIYRTSLREWRFLRRFSALFDIAFWLFGLVFVFTLLLGVNDGEVRIVTFVLLAIGYTVYHLTAHPLIVASTQLVVRFIYRVGVLVVQTFLLLFVRPVIWLWRTALAGVRLTDRLLARVEPLIVWPVWQALRLARKIIAPFIRKGKELQEALSKKTRTMVIGWLTRLRGDASEDLSEDQEQSDEQLSAPPAPPAETPDGKRRLGMFWFARRKQRH